MKKSTYKELRVRNKKRREANKSSRSPNNIRILENKRKKGDGRSNFNYLGSSKIHLSNGVKTTESTCHFQTFFFQKSLGALLLRPEKPARRRLQRRKIPRVTKVSMADF